jgi:hypothetical protein
MGSRRNRIRLFAVSTLLLGAALAPARALAAGAPALAATTIVSDGFEPGSTSRFVLDWALPSPGDPSPAYWGPVTAVKRTGLRSLWCAGSIPGQTTTTAWTTFSGRYPNYTAGLATLALPELSGYYSATLDYWYRMPSIGSNDGGSLNVLWSAAVGSDLWDYHASWPTVADWTHVTFDLTVPTPAGQSRPVDLSRTPGKVRFIFMDDTGAFESPTNGEGPAIDDVVVSGYKFGPVRGLHAAVLGGGVHLTWTAPARSVALSAPDEDRAVAYRVWRAPNVAPYDWTELTVARTTGTSFDDPDPRPGGSRYLVQAWDPGTGPGYGEVDVPGGTAAVLIGSPPPVPLSTITVSGGNLGPGDVYTATPTVTVSRDATGTTYWRWDAGGFTPSSASAFQVPVLAGVHSLTVYSVNEADVAEATAVTRTVTVIVPPAPTRPVLGTPKASTSSPVHRRHFHITGSLSPAHTSATTVLVKIYRKVGSHYRYLRSHTVNVAPGATTFQVTTTLTSRGWYRVRTYHSDSAHLATYSAYRYLKVR